MLTSSFRRPHAFAGPVIQAAALLLASVVTVHAQPTLTFEEYPLQESARPGITTGPDGALWFTEFRLDRIGRVSTSGVVTEYPLPAGGPYGKGPTGITVGPDGALWFTETYGSKIGRITVAGVITEFPLPADDRMPLRITAGPDGALWYTEASGGTGRIGRVTTAGAVTEYEMPPCGGTCGRYPTGITAGPDGALWFTNLGDAGIWRITTAGVFTRSGQFVTQVGEIIADPRGALWFTGGDSAGPCDNLGRITTQGRITAFPLPIYPRPGFNRYNNLAPSSITKGRDGAMWFVASRVSVIGRVTRTGVATLYPLPGGAADDDRWAERSITTGPDGALWIANNDGIVRASISAIRGGVQVDVKPASWLNRIPVTATGSLPVAIIGSDAFDVEQIDLSSIRLEGVPALSGVVKHVAIGPGLCSAGGADSHLDLMLQFEASAVVAALSPLPETSEARVVKLTGRLKPEFGGKGIHGQDAVVLRVR